MSELPDRRNSLVKSCGCRTEAGAAKKGSPLHRLCSVVRKFVFQANRPCFDRTCAMIKRSFDCFEQDRSIKSEQTGERPQIEEILHPTIQHLKCGQRFQLLGNDCLFGISSKNGSWEFQSAGYSISTTPGLTTSPKPISICIGIRVTSKDCAEANPDSFVVRVLFDSGNLHRLGVELDTIRFDSTSQSCAKRTRMCSSSLLVRPSRSSRMKPTRRKPHPLRTCHSECNPRYAPHFTSNRMSAAL